MKTGDVLVARRFTGDSAQWMILEGSFANHIAMIVEEPGNFFPVSVIDCPSDKGYLSEEGGVRKLELNEWLSLHFEQGYEVAWLPLDRNLRAFSELNEDGVKSWFSHVNHSPYSNVHRFLAAVDTPDESFPAPLNAESFPINLRLYE